VGAAERIDQETGDAIDAYERATFSEAITPVVDRADQPKIAAAWTAGRKMSESDAAAYALAIIAEQSTLARTAS
jgi:hypothetical protein